MTRISLFTSNFKRIWKYLLAAMLTIMGVLAVYRGLSFLLVEEDLWARLMWHSYYAQDENIDNLFLGSSHVYCDINPEVLDNMTGETNFNLATASLNLDGAYYLLREADKMHDLKAVYLEMYYMGAVVANERKFNDVTNDWRNLDYMKWSTNKLDYFLEVSGPTMYADTLFPMLRFRSEIGNAEHIVEQIRTKQNEDYLNYRCINLEKGTNIQYCDKGFMYRDGLFEEKDWHGIQTCVEGENYLGETAEYYLRQIIEYCQDRDIDITLFSSPVTNLQVIADGKYDDYVKDINGLVNEYGIEYYDFNLCKTEYLPLNQESSYSDDDHLNAKGAAEFTELFGYVMKQTFQENAKYFHESYVEKLLKEEPFVYGIVRLKNSEEGNYMVISNQEIGMEYEITLWNENDESRLLQYYSENKTFYVEDTDKKCEVKVRKKGTIEPIQELLVEL